MTIFNALKTDYIRKLKSIDVYNFTADEQNIISEYRTPNRNYITSSARDISGEEVDLETLEYILSKCHKCKTQEKYEASLILLSKLVADNVAKELIDAAKEELLEYISTEAKKSVTDLSFLDESIKGYENDFFYLIELTIGKNKILKYGITDNNPRARFAQVKSDIKFNYKSFALSVKPLILLHCTNNTEFESELKSLLIENDLYRTNYDFKGSSETVPTNDIEATISLIDVVAQKLSATQLYRLDEIQQLTTTHSDATAVNEADETLHLDTVEEDEQELLEPIDTLDTAPIEAKGGLYKMYYSDSQEQNKNLPPICDSCGNKIIDGYCGGDECI